MGPWSSFAGTDVPAGTSNEPAETGRAENRAGERLSYLENDRSRINGVGAREVTAEEPSAAAHQDLSDLVHSPRPAPACASAGRAPSDPLPSTSQPPR